MEIEVKVTQMNSIAGIEYSRGVSIIHLCLFITWFYVIHPDVEYAATFSIVEEDEDGNSYYADSDCHEFAEKLEYLLRWLLVNHLICVVTCFLTEIFETALGWRGKAIRILDLLSCLFNFLEHMEVTCYLFRFYGYQANGSMACYKEEHVERTFGLSIQWLIIEFAVFYMYLATLLTSLIK